jgi:Leucine-rich repeat (LRR) protein
VPPGLAELPALETVSFKNNRLVALGDNLLPVSLRALIVTENALEELPASIGRLTRLQKLMASRNRFGV